MTRTVGGRYRLYEFLAGGDTGEVWQALDLGTDRTVAVKLLYPDLAADPRLVDRFVRARGQLTMLWHPSIARLLDIVVEEGTLALVTDLVPGGVDLGRRLAREGPLDAGSASAVGAAVADALSTAHQLGVVHGDVKPSNVVIPARGEGPACVTDFSVMLLVRAGRRYPEPFERLRYRAPEVTDGAIPVPPSDVYALGAMLGEMLPGNSPARLRMIAEECVRPDPGARPSAAEIGHELGTLAARLESAPAALAAPARAAIGAGPTGTRTRAQGRSAARGPAWLFGSPTRMAAVFGVALALVLAAFAVTRPWEPESDQSGEGTRTPGGSTGGAASATGTSKAPPLPAAAGAHTREGGAAFVRYWFTLLNHAQGTGETAPLREATGPGCRECENVVNTIGGAYGDGGSMRGGVYVVRNVATNGLFTLDSPIYEATLDRSPRATLDRTGVERASLAGLTVANCMVSLDWTGNRWRVAGVPTAGCVA